MTSTYSVKEFMARSVLEVMPSDTLEQKIRKAKRGQIIDFATHGNDNTLAMVRAVADLDFSYIVNIQARSLKDKAELDALLGAYWELGIRNLFVVGGDVEKPAGIYGSASQALADIRSLNYGWESIGVAAYPEGSQIPGVTTANLEEALLQKQEMADYMVSQMCFNPETIIVWIQEMREKGITLPLRIGLPGVYSLSKLIGSAHSYGVGKSVSFLLKNPGMLNLRGILDYDPSGMVEGLLPYVKQASLKIDRFHFFTFNQLDKTSKFVDNYN